MFLVAIWLPITAAAEGEEEQNYVSAQAMQDPVDLKGILNFFKKNISVLSPPGGLNISPTSGQKISLGRGRGIDLNQLMDFALKVVRLLYDTGVYFFSGVFKLLGLDSLWRSILNLIQFPKQ